MYWFPFSFLGLDILVLSHFSLYTELDVILQGQNSDAVMVQQEKAKLEKEQLEGTLKIWKARTDVLHL